MDYVVQGYLPSDLSSSVSLARAGQSIEASLSRSYSQIYLNYSINNISRIFSQSGFLPIKSLLNIMNPFSGYHFGSSLPMSNKSLNLNSTSTDLYGRLKNVRNIHVLDSSILPNIPAGSYSFTVMANAIRIVKSIKDKKI
jgi:choline dehydrogenase-like flavoprotein